LVIIFEEYATVTDFKVLECARLRHDTLKEGVFVVASYD
jgi:hypothetical protein